MNGGTRKRSAGSVPWRMTATKLVGIPSDKAGASPHNLLADTLGDELKLATQGKSRVFGISLKDRAAILPAGFAGDGAYWIDPEERSLDYLHLLSQRTSEMGAEFRRRQA